MVDTPSGETATPSAPSNDTGNTTAPVGDNSSADVEAAKKEAEQARMRANQLENELAKIKEAQSAAERKQLEEKEEYKQLFEKTNAELESIRQEKEANERRAQLAAATDDVFKDYPSNVVDLAKTAGLSLSDDSDVARASLKEKLDTFAKSVGAPTASPNNPSSTGPAATGQPEGLGRPKTIGFDDGGKGLRQTDDKKVGDYIRTIPAIQEMKKQAGIAS